MQVSCFSIWICKKKKNKIKNKKNKNTAVQNTDTSIQTVDIYVSNRGISTFTEIYISNLNIDFSI